MNKLDSLRFYQMACELYELCWDDCNVLMKDIRGKEITRQLIRAVGSICANIEEGYGRTSSKEYTRFLSIARGSAQESKGWYTRSNKLLNHEIIKDRTEKLDSIIAMISSTIKTINQKNKS
jgi:four helix bundle protein